MPASSISRGRRFVAVAVATVLALAVAGPLPAYAEPTDPPETGGLVAASPQATLVASVVTDPIVTATDPRPAGVAALASDEGVYLPDAALSLCIADRLGLPANTAYFDPGATAEIDYVYCGWDNGAIRSLQGLDQFDWSSLATIVLEGHQLTDISPLAGFDAPNLTYLDLAWNEISDLTPLTALASVRMINLAGNHIADVTPLASMASLGTPNEWGDCEFLNLESNWITDLRPLAGLACRDILYAGGQYLALDVPPGSSVQVQVFDIDGTRLPLTAFDETQNIRINNDTGVIAVDYSGWYWFEFGEADGHLNGTIMIDGSRPTGYQGTLPDRPNLVNQADVFVVTVDDPDWLSERTITGILDGAMDWWSRETGLDFGLEPTILRQVLSADQCDYLTAVGLAQAAFGTTPADYTPDQARNLIVMYDEATCDLLPGTSGVAVQYSPDPMLAAGGVVSMRAFEGDAVYFGSGPTMTLAHELGHVYGLHHAMSHSCSDTFVRLSWDERLYLDSDCYLQGYGDLWSVMGSPDDSGAQHLTAFERYWLGLETLGETATYLGQPGTYEVDLVPTTGDAGTQVLLVRNPDAAEVPEEYDEWVWGNFVWDEFQEGFVYSLEFRADDTGLLGEGAAPGVYISAVIPWGTDLVGETLLQPTGLYYTPQALHAGQIFTSVTGQVTVEVLSESAGSARLRITITEDDVINGRAYLAPAAPGNPWGVSLMWYDEPDAVTYQWLRDGKPIPGATGETYTPSAPADSGHIISVRLTASRPGLGATTVESDGAWFDFNLVTVPDEPVPADGVSVMDVVVDFRDALNQPVLNQQYAVLAYLTVGNGVHSVFFYSTEDPDVPGLYHLPITSAIPGDSELFVYGPQTAVTVTFARTTDNRLVLWPDEMIVVDHYSYPQTVVAFTATDSYGNPASGLNCAFTSTDPGVRFISVASTTDLLGACHAAVGYDLGTDPWPEGPGGCRTVDVTLDAGGVTFTTPLRVCSAYHFTMNGAYTTVPADGVTAHAVYVWLLDEDAEPVVGQADVIQFETTGGTLVGELVEMYPGNYEIDLVSDTPGDITVTATWHDLTTSATFTFTPPPANPFGQLTEFLHRLIQLIHDLVTGLQGLGR
jgi:hypothetical protein